MMTTKEAANAVAGSGRTTRACKGCLRKRAWWYCTADDAFLCQGCDLSVHSANQLAGRHERVRIDKMGPKATFGSNKIEDSPPVWHRGFTRKARTPRHGKSAPQVTNLLHVVPEIGCEEASPEESEEQLLYQVPVFDPFDAELCHASNEVENILGDERESGMGGGLGVLMRERGHEDEACDELDNLHGSLPSDMDLAEFAADVESLLRTGLDQDSCGIEGLGLLYCKEEDDVGKFLESRIVKVEDVDGVGLDAALEFERETMDWNFDYESPVTGDEEKVVVGVETATMSTRCEEEVKRKMILRLNYEGVISAWDRQGCPWTTGSRPELNPNDGWPDFLGWGAAGYAQPCGGTVVGGGDGGREARVTRYREKRRTRLFSKKIRYEVRKLNAEKRPRMKGRFVKRASFAATPPHHHTHHRGFPYL